MNNKFDLFSKLNCIYSKMCCCKNLISIDVYTGILGYNKKKIDVGYYKDKEIKIIICLDCNKITSGLKFINEYKSTMI